MGITHNKVFSICGLSTGSTPDRGFPATLPALAVEKGAEVTAAAPGVQMVQLLGPSKPCYCRECSAVCVGGVKLKTIA